MAPRTGSIRFGSVVFLGLLVFLSIYQATNSYYDHLILYSTQDSAPGDANILSQSHRSPEHVLHDLSKRAPPNNAAEALRKAQGYWCLLTDLDTDEDSPLHSKYTDPDDLDKYWTSRSVGVQGEPTDTGKTIPDALASLGLPADQGDQGLQMLYYEQDREFEVDGETQIGTYAHYKASMSPAAGYISAEDNESPDAASGGQYGNKIPFVKALSDVYFLMWQSLAIKQKRKVVNLKYFVRHHVINDHSKKIALEVANNDVRLWPGVSYPMTSDEGKSILGTPNGAGVAFFLYQHKPELGVRVPTKVTLFKTIGEDHNNQPEDWIHFLFEIAPYSGKGKKGKGKKGKGGK